MIKYQIFNNNYLSFNKCTNIYTIRYEDIVRKPNEYAAYLMEYCDLEFTDTTRHHIETIQSFTPSDHPSVIDQIQEPELAKFVELNEVLGYGTLVA